LPGLGHDSRVSAEDAAIGRVVVGADVPRALGIDDRKARFESPDQDIEGRTGLGEIAKANVDAFGGHAALDGDDEVVGVIRNAGAEEIDRAEKLAVKFTAEDQFVGGGARANGMEIEQSAF